MNIPTRRPRLQWNPRVHLDWGKERLYFWRLALPTYNRNRVLPVLRRVLQDFDVNSYACYEMMGLHDLIIKAWLPAAHSQADFRNALRSEFNPRTLDVFYADAPVRHWPWGDSDRPIEPRATLLSDGLAEDEIMQINSGRLTRDQFRRYEAAKLIVRVSRSPGIKFVVAVATHGAESLTEDAFDELQHRLCTILDKAQSVREKSLYVGTGFSKFILMGRLQYSKFHKLAEEITDTINSDVMPAAYGARTYTYVSNLPDLLDFRDHLPAATERIESRLDPVTTYLEAIETDTLEVKGSAFVNLDSWLRKGGRPQKSEAILEEGVLKALVGFLNAKGGTIVIGAVEAKQYPDQSRLADYPRVGDYICCGIRHDYGSRGDWDAFERRLHDAISQRIRPGPLTPWYTITPDDVEGHPLAIVTVTAPDHGWYYLYPAKDGNPVFYVREGNRTKPLIGFEADRYRDARRRGGR
jgi:schlafen family protein